MRHILRKRRNLGDACIHSIFFSERSRVRIMHVLLGVRTTVLYTEEEDVEMATKYSQFSMQQTE